MRAPALFLAGALVAAAQPALFTTGPERPVGNSFDMGAIAVGDAADAPFRLRNTGNAALPVNLLSVAGTGFSIASAPALPRVLAPGGWFDFTVRFEPGAPGAYSASLRAGSASTILLAAAAPAYEAAVEESDGWRILSSGNAVDFGAVERGVVASRRFAFSNRHGAGPARLEVSPGAFALEAGAPRDVSAQAGERVIVTVRCRPETAGVHEAVLSLGDRRFPLRAEAIEPALPRPELVVELAEERSARQGRIAVRFAEASRASAGGLVRLAFEPAPGLGADPGVVFASGGREAVFSVAAGEAAARFGGRPYLEFQTGSTAGALVFTLEAGGHRETRQVTVARAPVGIAAASAKRTATSIEIEVGGLDNTRAVSRVTFTFYARGGAVVAPGPVHVDVGEAFRRYFEGSPAGGTFLLRAAFPVTGGAERIEAVEAELLNPAGTTSTGTLHTGLAGRD